MKSAPHVPLWLDILFGYLGIFCPNCGDWKWNPPCWAGRHYGQLHKGDTRHRNGKVLNI